MPTGNYDWENDEFEERPRRRRPRPKPKSNRLLFWLLGGLGVLIVGCLGCCGVGIWWFLKPTSFPEQTEDYADARSKFQTRLLRQGPAPQGWDREQPPPDAQEIEYVSGNLRLRAWIDSQRGGPPKPAVLYLHGGFAFGEDDWEQAQPFRAAGFITMTPMVRAENGLPGNYTMFYDEVDDVVAAAESLARQPGVDPTRIFVAGHSAGGTLTLLAAMTSKRFRAAASFSGSCDQVAFVRGQEELAPFDVDNDRELQMRSPLAFSRSFKCPTRLYYGSQEFLFGPSTEKTAEVARKAGLDVSAVSVPGDHFTSVSQAMRQAIAFFQQVK